MLKQVMLPLIAGLVLDASYTLAQPAEQSTEPEPPPAVTTVLPAEVGGVVFMNTQQETWGTLSRFFPIPPGFAGPGFLPYMPDGLDFSLDIRPWLGDWAAIAVMAPNASNSPSDPNLLESDINTLMVAPVKNADQLEFFLEKVQDIRGKAPIKQQYQGVTILVWPEEDIPEGQFDPTLPLTPQLTPNSKIFLPTWKASLERLMPDLKSLKLAKHLGLPLLAQAEPEAIPPLPPNNYPELPPLPPPIIPGLAIAVVPGYIVAANTAAPIEQWLNTKNSSTTLAQSPEFQRTLDNPDFRRSLFVAYGNMPQLAKAFANIGFFDTTVPFPVPTPDSQVFQDAFDSLATAYSTSEMLIWFQEEGLRTQVRLYHQTPKSEIASNPNQITFKIPAATYISLNGMNWNQQWQTIAQGFSSDLETGSGLQVLRDFTRDSLGLDLDQDIMRWIDGEYGLFIFPTSKGLFPTFDPRLQIGIGLVLQTSDRPAAERVFSKLDEYIKTLPDAGITVNTQMIKDQPVSSWVSPNGPNQGPPVSMFAHGWADEKTLILTSGIGPMEELNPQPYLTLDQSFTFQNATKPLPSPNNGYFYMNMGSLLSLIYNLLPPQLNESPESQAVKSILGNIRSISLNTSATQFREQSDFLMVLSPRRN